MYTVTITVKSTKDFKSKSLESMHAIIQAAGGSHKQPAEHVFKQLLEHGSYEMSYESLEIAQSYALRLFQNSEINSSYHISTNFNMNLRTV